jgi:hypothetical protein
MEEYVSPKTPIKRKQFRLPGMGNAVYADPAVRLRCGCEEDDH